MWVHLTHSEGIWALAWSTDRISAFLISVSFSTHGKCTLSQNKHALETRQFPRYSTFSKYFNKQRFAAIKRSWQDVAVTKDSGVYLLQAFLDRSAHCFLHPFLEVSSSKQWIRESPSKCENDKCCFCCCCLSSPLWLLVRSLPGTRKCQTDRKYGVPITSGNSGKNRNSTCRSIRWEHEGKLLREDMDMTTLNRDFLHTPKQNNTVMAFCASCDIKKKSPTIRNLQKAIQGFPGGTS